MTVKILLIITLVLQFAYVQDQDFGIEENKDKEAVAASLEKEYDTNDKAKTSGIAENAAVEATAAHEAQAAASEQASHQVKLQLAERAEDAAKTAEAAHLGKQEVVDELQRELKEAKEAAREQLCGLQEVNRTLDVALKAAQAAQSELKLLQEAHQVAQTNCVGASQTAKGVQALVQGKDKLIDAAKARVNQIQDQLKAAEKECAAARQASEKATAAAKEAKQNAERTRRKIVFLRNKELTMLYKFQTTKDNFPEKASSFDDILSIAGATKISSMR
ncbi:hypothetical protein FQA39_LY00516 [Lamprigera yunnana]|nr:hypothetical protein FQA39_LY00516 [Lamprigera yunnana]